MSYWDNEDFYAEKGIDYDLAGCLEYNKQPDFILEDIKKVLAVVEGQNDGADWHWVLELNSGDYYYLRGGCDYTGWDCQSWASSMKLTSLESLEEIISDGKLPVTAGNSPYNAGLGHMLQILSGNFRSGEEKIIESLILQLENGKNLTWRETTKNDFPDVPKVK